MRADDQLWHKPASQDEGSRGRERNVGHLALGRRYVRDASRVMPDCTPGRDVRDATENPPGHAYVSCRSGEDVEAGRDLESR
jgi:hypothetical protein